ncbi:hypothetical protein LTR85_000376 [Meristemomyces frigidus]|nr:hypothetical protein LTR85_000376 [Meristemomyces frigidus]
MHTNGTSNGENAHTQEYTIDEHRLGEARHVRIVCIGAGAAGLNLAYHVKKYLQNVDFCIYEKNASVGGTWLENSYPGVGCDIPAHNYQYTWEPNPDWSQFYSSGPEIRTYLEAVAEKHGLVDFIQFRHQVVEAEWQEDDGTWHLRVLDLATGNVQDDVCHFFINAGGYLNDWVWPDIAGLDDFQGRLIHSASWPADVELAGKRVAVLGNGSSGIQIVPALHPRVAQMVTFIRNPTWVTAGFAQKYSGPNGTNFAYSEEQKQRFREDSEAYLVYRKGVEKELVTRFPLLHKDSPEQAAAVRFSREEMQRRLGTDNPLLDHLVPDFGVGCRRPTPGVGYLEALTQPNVRVVTDRILRVAAEGVVLEGGELIPVDAFICATGFDVSFRPRFPVVGRDGIDLAKQWEHRPTGYLSLAAANMPNHFMFQGPNSPVGHGSAMQIIEHSTKYMLKMIYKAQTERYKAFAPKASAVADFVEHADKFLERTVWAGNCKSWFKNGTVDGPVTALHPGSRIHWFHMLTNPRYEDWEWTSEKRNRFAYLGNGFSTWEMPERDVTWYLNDPSQGYETLIY